VNASADEIRSALDRAPSEVALQVAVDVEQQSTNPGVTIRDPLGREWYVKQPPHNDQGAKGPIEVTLRACYPAVGDHQPLVYFLPAFSMKDT
jgi:hypothetical protein